MSPQKQDEIEEIKASGKTADEKKAETKAILEAGVKEVHAMLFFVGADVTKHGSLLRKLRSDYGRRLPNVYPKDLQDAVNTLNTHTWDQAYHDAKKQKRQQAKEQKQKEPASESNQTSFAQKGKDIICFICGDPTHKSPDCNQKDKPKSEWWITKQKKSFAQQDTNSETGSNGGNSDNASVNTQQSNIGRGWTQGQGQQQGMQGMQRISYRPRRDVKNFMGFQQAKHYCFNQCCNPIVEQVELKDQILLDCGSGVKATFMNPDMVHNIRPTSNPINMTTNAGNTLLDTVATVPGWGEVHFHKDGMANIFGLHHMTQKHRVTFD